MDLPSATHRGLEALFVGPWAGDVRDSPLIKRKALIDGVNERMTHQEFVPVGALGERIRKAFVAEVL
jgi:hypothetical protein